MHFNSEGAGQAEEDARWVCCAQGPWCRLGHRSPAKNSGYPVIFRSLSNTPTSPKARLFFGTVLHFLEMIGRVRVKRRPKARERLEGNAPRSRKRAERGRGTGDSCRVVITLMRAPAALLVRAPAWSAQPNPQLSGDGGGGRLICYLALSLGWGFCLVSWLGIRPARKPEDPAPRCSQLLGSCKSEFLWLGHFSPDWANAFKYVDR